MSCQLGERDDRAGYDARIERQPSKPRQGLNHLRVNFPTGPEESNFMLAVRVLPLPF